MNELASLARLSLWRETAGGAAVLVNLSENHTFRVDAPDGGSFMLRVHRPGYQSKAAIASELEWVRALRRQAGLPVPEPIAGRDGELIQTFDGRHAVLFARQPGAEPTPDASLPGYFEVLGGYAAVAHRHAQGFVPSAGFIRPRWDADAILSQNGLWGDWRQAPRVDLAIRSVLQRLEQRLREDLQAYGDHRDRFGLIHADMRLANLLVDGDRITLIDFDDCGFGWFAYDFAAAISFIEDSPLVPELRESWLRGYAAQGELPAHLPHMLDAMVMLRRMALLAWVGSHAETDLAAGHASGFARVTAELAETYLSR